MRRHDKKIHMAKANRLFEQRCNESKFSWDGKYANESVHEEVVEGDNEDYNHLYTAGDENDPDVGDYTDPYAIKDDKAVFLGNDMEMVKEEEDEGCGCPLNQPDPTDVEKSQWFSREDGERLTDKIEP